MKRIIIRVGIKSEEFEQVLRKPKVLLDSVRIRYYVIDLGDLSSGGTK